MKFGELLKVHLLLDGPGRARRGALDACAVEGITLEHGDMSHSYLVWMPRIRQVRCMRSITRLPMSQCSIASKLEDIDMTKKDPHAGRGSQAVPFAHRHRETPGGSEIRTKT